MFERSDEALVKQACNGKSKAWMTLIKRHEKPLYNYALRMVGDPDDALDLLQDIFISVFKSLSSFRGDSKFKTWMFRIAHFRCVEYYRRKKPLQSLDDEPEQVATDVFSCPEESIHRDKQSQQLAIAMQQLPINQRTVVELKFFQHFTFDEIGKQLGVSSNTVKSRLYGALDKLRTELEVDYV